MSSEPLAAQGLPTSKRACVDCGTRGALQFDFTYAFQPIVDAATRSVFSYEALARGPAGEPAGWVLDQVTHDNQYRFDQACRVKAITLASQLGLQSKLNINFLPNAIYRPEDCIRTTLEVSAKLRFPIENIIFEVLETEALQDAKHLTHVFSTYKQLGFATAIDDFGAGFSGLNLLSDFQPDYIKLDMNLIRGIDADKQRRAIVRGVTAICAELGIAVIAEGVETVDEYAALADLGLHLFQGYLFARPAFQKLENAVFPEL